MAMAGVIRASIYEMRHFVVQRGTAILFHGQWSRLVDGCTPATKASQTLHAYTETNPIVFISHIIAPRHDR